jgi:pyruvate dehydrogenase E1 component alpha subunit
MTLPLVAVIVNNQWAISVPRKAQTGAKTLAQKGIAAGLECLQVDGNDLIAMRAAMDHAIKRARHGHGGTVIEAVTYRLSDHTTADDARRYRPDDEVKEAWQREPM